MSTEVDILPLYFCPTHVILVASASTTIKQAMSSTDTRGAEEMGTPPGTTKTWGKRSTHVLAIAPGAVLMVALAGCSLGNPTLNEPAPLPANEADAGTQPPTTSSDERPAFHFASGDLILGDFTYEDVAGNIFNPCEEISAEEFAAIGFETEGAGRERQVEQIFSCPIKSVYALEGQAYSLISGPGNFGALKGQAVLFQEYSSDEIPGLYVHGPSRSDGDVCYASVDTERGQLSAAVGAVKSAYSQDERCAEAIQILEKLYMN